MWFTSDLRLCNSRHCLCHHIHCRRRYICSDRGIVVPCICSLCNYRLYVYRLVACRCHRNCLVDLCYCRQGMSSPLKRLFNDQASELQSTKNAPEWCVLTAGIFASRVYLIFATTILALMFWTGTLFIVIMVLSISWGFKRRDSSSSTYGNFWSISINTYQGIWISSAYLLRAMLHPPQAQRRRLSADLNRHLQWLKAL